MKWKALAACTLAGLALIAAGCGGGDKAAAGGAKAGGQDLKGKKLVMYVSFHEDTAKELADLFKKQTGADVSFIVCRPGKLLPVSRQKKTHRKRISGSAERRTPMRKRRLTDFWKLINPRMPK